MSAPPFLGAWLEVWKLELSGVTFSCCGCDLFFIKYLEKIHPKITEQAENVFRAGIARLEDSRHKKNTHRFRCPVSFKRMLIRSPDDRPNSIVDLAPFFRQTSKSAI